MKLALAAQITRAVTRPRHAVAHVRCIMDNMGDRLLAEAIELLLGRMTLVDYSTSRMITAASALVPRRQLFRFTCLGGGTLIFGDIDRGWGAALQHALARTDLAFTVGTGVIDPQFRDELHRRHGLRPLPADSVERWLDHLRAFELITVRGNDSARLLREHGIDRAEVIGDPALYYAREHPTPKAQERRLGINLNNRSYFFGNANARVVEHFADLIRRLREKDWTITMYPMGPEDVAVTEETLRAVGDSTIRMAGWSGSLTRLFDDIGSQDVFIGVRLHSVAAAICTYTPAIMIGYQPKNVEFMETLGLEDHCMRIDAFDVDAMVDLVERLHESAPEVQARQYAACQEFRARLLGFRDRVYALADG